MFDESIALEVMGSLKQQSHVASMQEQPLNFVMLLCIFMRLDVDKIIQECLYRT